MFYNVYVAFAGASFSQFENKTKKIKGTQAEACGYGEWLERKPLLFPPLEWEQLKQGRLKPAATIAEIRKPLPASPEMGGGNGNPTLPSPEMGGD